MSDKQESNEDLTPLGEKHMEPIRDFPRNKLLIFSSVMLL